MSQETSSDGRPYEKRADRKGEPACIDEEVPFELPEGWAWARLGSLITLLSGVDLASAQYNDTRLGIPYITGASNFVDGNLLENRWTTQPSRISHRGDLLFTCKGTIGEMAINEFGEAHIARQIMAITPIESQETQYIEIFLRTMVDQIQSRAKGLIPGIERATLLTALLPVPPLTEQKRIVAALDERLSLVDTVERDGEELDALFGRLRSKVLDLAVRGELTERGPSDEPASELLARIHAEKLAMVGRGELKPKDVKGDTVIFTGSDGRRYEKRADGKGKPVCIEDEIPFEIPETWAWARLKSIFLMRAGKNIKGAAISQEMTQEKPYPCFGGNGIRGYVASANYLGDFPIIGRQGALCGNVHRARGTFYATEHAVVVTTFEGTDVSWACLFLEALKLDQYATATAQPGLAVSTIEGVLLPVPPLAEQRRIVNKACVISKLVTNL
jgi:type I restriction enzyme S subunit